MVQHGVHLLRPLLPVSPKALLTAGILCTSTSNRFKASNGSLSLTPMCCRKGRTLARASAERAPLDSTSENACIIHASYIHMCTSEGSMRVVTSQHKTLTLANCSIELLQTIVAALKLIRRGTIV